MNGLYWLPQHSNFREAISLGEKFGSIEEQLNHLRGLASHQLDFTQTMRLDRRLQKLYSQTPEGFPGLPTLKLAILASSTVDHLPPSIRLAALRRGLVVDIYVAPYGQYRQELLDPNSYLYQFAPDAVLLALDPSEVGIQLPLTTAADGVAEKVENRVNEWIHLWGMITSQLKAVAIHQTMVVPVERLFGQYDALVPAAPANIFTALNQTLKAKAAQYQTLLLDLESLAASVGKQNWCDHALWHHSKQDVSPVQAPLYGEQVARLLAAIRGHSRKCLVLDLDNTLWGGVIGDDGLTGIELGQGSAAGEAFQAFQTYVKALKERGIILAVCSKNNESNALEPFERHPEMLLRREDIAAFVANWEDKASNLKTIAAQLNIGLDSLVFFDDNPVERAIVRQFAPSVAVPEVPEDPAWYTRCLSDAGYFEAITFSSDDAKRAGQYVANTKRDELKEKSHSIEDFLQQLDMQMTIAPIDALSLQRSTQLINKSNQFNLTTRRYTEAQVKQMSEDPDVLSLQIRLKDAFGDNGLISVIIAKPIILDSEKALHIDIWLMSCRVLGRQVEMEALNILVDQAQKRGHRLLQGEYIQTAKNDMVREHYKRLGFEFECEKQDEGDSFRSLWKLDMDKFSNLTTSIKSTYIEV